MIENIMYLYLTQKYIFSDFAKYVGPMVKSDRNLIGPIKPTFFSDQMSAIVRTEYPYLPMSVPGFLVLVL